MDERVDSPNQAAREGVAEVAPGRARLWRCATSPRSMAPLPPSTISASALEPGTTVALLGGNGAGKTTTIAMLLGLVMPTSGEVQGVRRRYEPQPRLRRASAEFPEPLCRSAGAAHGQAEPDRLCRALRHRQSRPSASPMSPRICRSRRCSTARPASCRPARRPASASPRRCSTRRSCSCSTSRPPRSIPTPPTGSGGSFKHYAESRRATLLFASHNMAEVERLADRVILLDAGRIIEDGTPGAADRDLWQGDAGGGVSRRGARARARAVAEAGGRACCPRGKRHEHGASRSQAAPSPMLLPQTGLRASLRRIGALVRALYLSVAQLRRAAGRAHLLAVPADADLGLPAEISGRDHEPVGPGRRRADRLGAAVGYSVPLQDRLLHHLHRRDVVAQSRQSADEPVASVRACRGA